MAVDYETALAGFHKTRLLEIEEALEEIAQLAEEEGMLAITHKVEEALGPLRSAIRAAEQYRDGTLIPD